MVGLVILLFYCNMWQIVIKGNKGPLFLFLGARECITDG